jgi:hypothetical protein
VCVLCYYEAIRDPLPSAFTIIGAVRLHSHVHQQKHPLSVLRVFLIARASALANAAGAACCTCTLARHVPACIRRMCHGLLERTRVGIGTRTWVWAGGHVSDVAAGMHSWARV